MKQIVICGWSAGFKKVSLTKMLRERANYSLVRAKNVTDAVLNNQSVVIEIPDVQFEYAIKDLNEIGVKFEDKPGRSHL
jgi:hypothetical protein